jgi:hypothetical protein
MSDSSLDMIACMHTPSNLDFNSWRCSQRDHTKNNFTYGPSQKHKKKKKKNITKQRERERKLHMLSNMFWYWQPNQHFLQANKYKDFLINTKSFIWYKPIWL